GQDGIPTPHPSDFAKRTPCRYIIAVKFLQPVLPRLNEHEHIGLGSGGEARRVLHRYLTVCSLASSPCSYVQRTDRPISPRHHSPPRCRPVTTPGAYLCHPPTPEKTTPAFRTKIRSSVSQIVACPHICRRTIDTFDKYVNR
uniref:Uncharacterized protein n=1 Tax=Aegilops tauschii subsp. strangulata TaxID=200361 RepID=A0A452YYS1_AEGTS